MGYAVIKTGGKQYRVSEGDTIDVEKLDAEVGSKATFEDIVLISDGKTAQVGAPTVAGAKVTAKVLEQRRAPKILSLSNSSAAKATTDRWAIVASSPVFPSKKSPDNPVAHQELQASHLSHGT